MPKMVSSNQVIILIIIYIHAIASWQTLVRDVIMKRYLSPRRRLRKRVTAVRVQDLLVVEDTSWTSQHKNGSSHVGVLAGAAGGVGHLTVVDTLVVLIGATSGHLEEVSDMNCRVLIEE
jgi:hypothetical protein